MILFAARPRARVTDLTGPMAIPIEAARRPPLGSRVAQVVHDAVAQTQLEAVRRIVLWIMLSLCIGALALAYLFQTSMVASLGSERATIERETVAVRDANARLAGQAAVLQTLGRAAASARDQGLRPAPPGGVRYVTIPDAFAIPATSTAAPAKPPGLRARIVNALTGRASADHLSATVTPDATPGGRP